MQRNKIEFLKPHLVNLIFTVLAFTSTRLGVLYYQVIWATTCHSRFRAFASSSTTYFFFDLLLVIPSQGVKTTDIAECVHFVLFKETTVVEPVGNLKFNVKSTWDSSQHVRPSVPNCPDYPRLLDTDHIFWSPWQLLTFLLKSFFWYLQGCGVKKTFKEPKANPNLLIFL